MKTPRGRLALAFLIAGLLPTLAVAEPKELPRSISKASAQLAVVDLEGKECRPLQLPLADKLTVLVFTTVDCPVANAYHPALRRIANEYKAKGVHFFLVQVDPTVNREAATRHRADYGITMRTVLDPQHALVRAAGAAITPEAVVIDHEGRIRYRGRIDDWYHRLGTRRAAPRTHDLRDALDALLAGEAPALTQTEAIGCWIADFLPPDAGAGSAEGAPTEPGPSAAAPPHPAQDR